MPNPPYQYYRAPKLNGQPTPSFELTSLGEQVNDAERKRQIGFDLSRTISLEIVKMRDSMETDDPETAEKLQQVETSFFDAVGHSNNGNGLGRVPREANLGSRIEDAVRLMAFDHFLKTASLIPLSSCPICRDEEYLAGACMGLCQSLARYGMGRAITRDIASVVAARKLVQEILDYLLQMDFRNGYLRRRYDGCKYALKSLETILYELSVTAQESENHGHTQALPITATNGDQPPKAKRSKGESAIGPETAMELEGIRKRMEHRDSIRETLIKRCRDGQKAAKQAIFALHRGDHGRAYRLLTECEDCIVKDLMPIIHQEPPLRTGAFAAVMEEYVEAKLFYTWLNGKEETPDDESTKGFILPFGDFGSTMDLEPVEYLGGLCDMTGEIGRYAVKCGTERDLEGVKKCLDANASICTAIELMARYPSSIGKKMGYLKMSVEKLERMLYEISLSEAAGGLKVSTVDLGPPGPASAAALSAGVMENGGMKDANNES